jgi:CRP/FNR family transcriptional regulator, cyclic AMP receptor protein
MESERATEAPETAASLSPDQIRDKLRSVALFEGLGGADLDQLLGISESVLVEAGEYVFEEGERGDHFYIIVRGEIELRKGKGAGSKKLAVLREGQAFGEMALLNQTPRSASAMALRDTYMLSVSRAAFGEILGGETLAVRLLRNLSKALWATSVRLAAKQAQVAQTDTPHEALADFNRLLRSRLLPRVTPRVTGFDLTASTLAPRQGVGSSAWDWILLTDGRPVFVVMRSSRADIFSAQRLAAFRSVLRTLAGTSTATLGGLLTEASRGLRSGWIEGLSGPVDCGLVALTDGAAEWAGAGAVHGVLVRAGGHAEGLTYDEPPAGEVVDHVYESRGILLGNRDKIVVLSDAPADAIGLVTSVLSGGYTSSSRDALNKVFARLSMTPARGSSPSDLTGAVITRTRSPS